VYRVGASFIVCASCCSNSTDGRRSADNHKLEETGGYRMNPRGIATVAACALSHAYLRESMSRQYLLHKKVTV